MEVQVIDITSAEHVKVKASHFPAYIVLETNEVVSVPHDGIGFIEGKRSHQVRGVFVQSGIIHPGWSGKLNPCLVVMNEVEIFPGQKIAHAIIVSD